LRLLSMETFWSSEMMLRTHLLHAWVSALIEFNCCNGRVAAAYVSASIHCRDSSCGKGIPHACPQQPISARKFTHIWSATMARGMRTYQSGGRQAAEVAEGGRGGRGCRGGRGGRGGREVGQRPFFRLSLSLAKTKNARAPDWQ
jgi:hypothetical protein